MKAPRFIIRLLQRWARRIVASRDPDMVIGRNDRPYMLRWYVFRMKWLGEAGLFLHLFLEDDDDVALHDHPFRSLSIVVDGEMREIYAQRGWEPTDPTQHSVRMIRGRDIVLRSAKFSHRIELISKTALTFFFVGPHEREWGFWCPKIGWRHWLDYCDPNDHGKVGRGCD